MTQDHRHRLERLATSLPAAGYQAVILLPGANLRYFTGVSFHLMERPTMLIVVPDHPAALVLPEFERSKGEAIGPSIAVFSYGEDPATRGPALAEATVASGVTGGRVGVEPLRMRWLEQHLLEEAVPGIRLDSADPVLEPLRAEKGPDEIGAITRAVAIAQAALSETLPLICPGISELEVAAELTLRLYRAGSEPDLPFSPIVASGPNSALPHAVPTDRPLQAGDLVLLDWGATVDGYISDLTRTFALGQVEPEFERIHRVVEQANAAGRAAARPGAACGDIDRAARSVIDAAGYGGAFLHRTGHGIGLEAHEPPYLRDGNDAVLRPGNVFTVEPGIYLAGRGGVRLEDNLVITAEGAETLSSAPRELRRLAE